MNVDFVAHTISFNLILEIMKYQCLWWFICNKLKIPIENAGLMLELMYFGGAKEDVAGFFIKFLAEFDLAWHRNAAWFKLMCMLTKNFYLPILLCPIECVNAILELIDHAECTATGIVDTPPSLKAKELKGPFAAFYQCTYSQCPSEGDFEYFNFDISKAKERVR